MYYINAHILVLVCKVNKLFNKSQKNNQMVYVTL